MNIDTANRLKQLRQRSGLSQEDLAEKLSISRQAISKWERGEAAPDLENLITLSKLYNVTIDEILTGNKPNQSISEDQNNSSDDNTDTATNEDNSSNETESKTENCDCDKDNKAEYENPTKDYVHISPKNGIHVHTVDGDHVDISLKDGVQVHSKDGDDVDISFGGGVKINNKDFSEMYSQHRKKHGIYHALNVFPYPVLTVIIYLLLGFLTTNGFSYGWLVFLTIPLYYTFIKAIHERNAHIFAYPVLVVIIYLYAGMIHDIWHPTWVLFLTVPLYYCIVDGLNRMRSK